MEQGKKMKAKAVVLSTERGLPIGKTSPSISTKSAITLLTLTTSIHAAHATHTAHATGSSRSRFFGFRLLGDENFCGRKHSGNG